MNNRFLLWSSQLPLSISEDFRHAAKAESRKYLVSELQNLSDYAKEKRTFPRFISGFHISRGITRLMA
jgi:hypothetical protein